MQYNVNEDEVHVNLSLVDSASQSDRNAKGLEL